MKKMTWKMRLLGGLVAVSMLFAGCAQGVDDETFVSTVTNTQLESPNAADLAISFVTDASGAEQIKVSWPTQLGAGGYICNVWNWNDPENPVILVENEEVDGSSFTFALLDDTNFRIEVKTLGNKQYNNKDAVEATAIEYFVGVKGLTIENGKDIGEFIAADIAKNADAWAAARANDPNFEVAYDLVPGGKYTMNTQIDFGLQPARIRCLAEGNRAQIVMGDAINGVYTAAGLRFANINFDCAKLPAKNGQGVVTLTPVQYPELIMTPSKGDPKLYELKKPVRFENCNFKNVPGCFFSTGRSAWAMRQLDITNCIIQLNNNLSGDGSDIISAYDSKGTYVGETQIWRGAIQKVAIRNSTIYNMGDCGGRFMRWGNNDLLRHFESETGEFLMEDCTLIHPCVKQSQFTNNTPNKKGYKIIFNNNVLYDVCYINKLIQSSCTKDINKKFNTIDTVTQNDGKEDGGDLNYCTAEDPKFAAPMSELDLDDSEFGGQNFKASGAISSTVGDPRWLK